MKNVVAFVSVKMLAFGLLLLILGACKKNDFAYLLPVEGGPVLGDFSETSLTYNTARFSVTITSTGDSPITAKGICWSRSPNPTINDSKTNVGAGASPFSTSATNLKTDTLYYVRAYATNSQGTNYSETIEITPPERVVPLCRPTNTYLSIGSSSRYLNNPGGSNQIGSNGYYFYSAEYNSWAYNDYLRIKFTSIPSTGRYVTRIEGSSSAPKTCIVESELFGTSYSSMAGDTVYVEKLDTDRYTMTLCNTRVQIPGNTTVYRLTSKISN